MKKILSKLFNNNATLLTCWILFIALHIYIFGGDDAEFGLMSSLLVLPSAVVVETLVSSKFIKRDKQYYYMPLIGFVWVLLLSLVGIINDDCVKTLKFIICAVSYVLWYPIIWINNDRLSKINKSI